MVKYFTEQANLFSQSQRRVKIKPESEISSHITLASVFKKIYLFILFIYLFLIFKFYFLWAGVKLAKTPHNPS